MFRLMRGWADKDRLKLCRACGKMVGKKEADWGRTFEEQKDGAGRGNGKKGPGMSWQEGLEVRKWRWRVLMGRKKRWEHIVRLWREPETCRWGCRWDVKKRVCVPEGGARAGVSGRPSSVDPRRNCPPCTAGVLVERRKRWQERRAKKVLMALYKGMLMALLLLPVLLWLCSCWLGKSVVSIWKKRSWRPKLDINLC